MDAQVIDPRVRHARGLAREARDAAAWHFERQHFARDGLYHLGWRDLEHRGERIAIEDHVEILVTRDARHDLVGDRVIRIAARVLMRYPRGQLLERRIRKALQDIHVVVIAGEDVLHAAALERDRVDVPGYHEVVADHDGVPPLFRGPAIDPVLPRAVALAEHLVDQ